MGVTYSENTTNEETITEMNKLRLSYEDIDKLITAYFLHQFEPVMETERLTLLFHAAFGWNLNSNMIGTVKSCQQIFQENSCILYTQEILVVIALLCESSWKNRAGLLYNIFKCIGTENMGYEDFIFASQIVAKSLCKLWSYKKNNNGKVHNDAKIDKNDTNNNNQEDRNNHDNEFIKWDVDSMSILSEKIADNAYMKLDKDIEDTVEQDNFVKWAIDRFKESRTVATPEALKLIFTSSI